MLIPLPSFKLYYLNMRCINIDGELCQNLPKILNLSTIDYFCNSQLNTELYTSKLRD